MTTKTKKQKTWKYPIWAKVYQGDKVVVSMMTQLYQIGVYGIMNNNPSQQGSFSPSQMVKQMKQFRPENLKEGMDLRVEFGREITVTENEDGFYVEVVNKNEDKLRK